jgi:CHASE3 domain sensor protein
MNIVSRPGLLRNLQIGFGLSLFILIVTSVASWSSIHNLLDSSKWVDHSDSVINAVNTTLTTLTEAETGQRGFLLTGDTAFLRPYNGANERALSMIDRIQGMTMDNPVQQENVKALRDDISNRLILLQTTVDQKKADNIFNLNDIRKGRVYMEQARAIVRRMQDEEHRLLAIRLEKVRKFSTYTPILIIAAALLSLLITVFFYSRVHRDFLERSELYAELKEKDADISRRITIISGIAEDISAGKYQCIRGPAGQPGCPLRIPQQDG